MALSANAIINTEKASDYLIQEYEVASGAIHIYKGAHLNFNSSGYVKLGEDAASEIYAGIALDELDQAAGGSDGDNKIKVIIPASTIAVKVTITTGSLTVANLGATVYVDGDDAFDLVGGVSNNVKAGKIVQIASATEAWVQLLAD